MAGFDLNTPLGQALISEGQARGYTPEQISGVVGGAMTENGLNTDGAPGDNGTAFGGFQWRGPRFQALQQRAAAMGLPWTDPRVQASHIYGELGSSEAGAGMGNAQSPQDAAGAIVSALRPAGYTPGNPQNATNYGKYLNNTVMAYRALNGAGGGDDSAPMMEGRTGSTGGMTPATADDTSNINNLLARYRFGSSKSVESAPETDDPVEKFGNGLTRFGAALMARDNPNAAYALLSGIKGQAKAKDAEWKDIGSTGDGAYRKQFNAKTGEYRDVPNAHPDTPDPDASNKDIDRNRKQFQVNANLADTSDELLSRLNLYRQAIADGKLHVTAYDRAHGFTSNVTNSSNENDAQLKSMEADLNKYILTTMNTLERGASTGKQLAAAEASIVPQGGKYSDRTVLDALNKMSELTTGIHNNAARANSSVLSKYPSIGDTGLVDPETQKDQDAGWYKQQYQDRMNRYSKFEKEQAPRYKQFIENYNKPKPSPTGGASTSFTDRYKKQFGGVGGPTAGPVVPAIDEPPVQNF